MTIAEMVAQLRKKASQKAQERAKYAEQINEIRSACHTEDRDPTDTEATKVREAAAARDKLDEEITELNARADELEAEERGNQAAQAIAARHSDAGTTQTTTPGNVNEPRTYSAERSAAGQASFFVDAFAAQQGNQRALERLNRNCQEAIVHGEISERATTTSSFAGLVVPQYLVDLAAKAIRSGRPVANACTGLPLPSQGMSLVVPRGTTGAAVASQATENSSVQSTDEVWANLTVPVVTIAGQQDVSRQSLERGTPGIDEIVYLDLAGAYHAELDRQVITGSGASGQMLGIFNTSGINAATAYGAALTAANFQLKVAGQIAAVAGVGAGIQPQLIFMAPRRWGWLQGLTDSTGRPLVIPTGQGPFNSAGVTLQPGGYGGDGNPIGTGETVIVGSMQGLPVTTDANVPTTVGTLSEDLVGVMDPRHALLWEDGDGMPKQLRFEQTLGNQLTVKLVIYGYAAFTAGRYPTAFGKTGGLDVTAGNGQIAPTF